MEFIETKIFSKIVTELLDPDSYMELQRTLIANPKAGAVIPGTGGLRKIRWSKKNTGKSGGARILYFFKQIDSKIYMIFAIEKNKQENITPAQKITLREIVEGLKNGK